MVNIGSPLSGVELAGRDLKGISGFNRLTRNGGGQRSIGSRYWFTALGCDFGCARAWSVLEEGGIAKSPDPGNIFYGGGKGLKAAAGGRGRRVDATEKVVGSSCTFIGRRDARGVERDRGIVAKNSSKVLTH